MEDAVQTRTPTQLWVVGILSLVWNAMGAFDYLMTQTRNEAYLSQFTEAQLAYFEGFPAWMELFWALGVWGAVAGSILLLMRSRHAVVAFAVSLLGLAVGTIYQYLLSSPPADLMTPGMIGFTVAIWVVAIALLLYARSMHEKRVLR